jgi:hypothetical protein
VCLVYEIYSKTFFLSGLLVFVGWGRGVVLLDLDKYLFLWQTWFYGGHLRLRVVLHLSKYSNVQTDRHSLSIMPSSPANNKCK